MPNGHIQKTEISSSRSFAASSRCTVQLNIFLDGKVDPYMHDCEGAADCNGSFGELRARLTTY